MHRKFPKIVSIAYYAGPNMNQLGLHVLSTPGPGKAAWGRSAFGGVGCEGRTGAFYVRGGQVRTQNGGVLRTGWQGANVERGRSTFGVACPERRTGAFYARAGGRSELGLGHPEISIIIIIMIMIIVIISISIIIINSIIIIIIIIISLIITIIITIASTIAIIIIIINMFMPSSQHVHAVERGRQLLSLYLVVLLDGVRRVLPHNSLAEVTTPGACIRLRSVVPRASLHHLESHR